jgi:hypothetical protein
LQQCCIIIVSFWYIVFHTVHATKERRRPRTNGTKFCAGGCLFNGNYPPYIDRPKIPRHNFAIYRYIFRHITGQKKTPNLSIFIVLYLEFIVFSFFRRHNSPVRLLLFAWWLSFVLSLGHQTTTQNTNTMKKIIKVTDKLVALICCGLISEDEANRAFKEIAIASMRAKVKNQNELIAHLLDTQNFIKEFKF